MSGFSFPLPRSLAWADLSVASASCEVGSFNDQLLTAHSSFLYHYSSSPLQCIRAEKEQKEKESPLLTELGLVTSSPWLI